jgi:integrase
MGVKVREKPPNSGIWWIFIDHQGKRKAKKIGKDKKLAQEVAKKIEARMTLGDVGLLDQEENNIPTLRQYVYGWKGEEGRIKPGWFEKQAQLALKRSTWLNYQTMLRVHILPELGAYQLNQISSRNTADFLVSKLKQGLRSKTVKNIKNCLSSILSHAHQPDGYIEQNPVIGVRVAKPEAETAFREPDPFSWEDRSILEETYREHAKKYYPMILAGFRTGLRLGELIALQWGDFDFKHKLIRVSRNIAAGRITTPKSKSSSRDVRMTNQLLEELKALRVRCKEEALGKGWPSAPEWVFYNETGALLNADNFRKRVWDRMMEKSGLRRRTPHDMRHTYATLRLSKGDSLAEVSKEMGHSSAEITYKTYYRWMPKESLTDIDELDNRQPDATYSQPKSKKG